VSTLRSRQKSTRVDDNHDRKRDQHTRAPPPQILAKTHPAMPVDPHALYCHLELATGWPADEYVRGFCWLLSEDEAS